MEKYEHRKKGKKRKIRRTVVYTTLVSIYITLQIMQLKKTHTTETCSIKCFYMYMTMLPCGIITFIE